MDNKEITEPIKRLCEKEYHITPQLSVLKGGGSSRLYCRLTASSGSIEGRDSMVGVYGRDVRENQVFISLAQYLKGKGLKVPEIYNVSEDFHIYLIEDLGDVSLFDIIESHERMNYSRNAIEGLVEFQNLPEKEWETLVGWSPFSARLVRWDLNYFKYDFLKPCGLNFDEELLEDDFEYLEEELLQKKILSGLMYRDFQSRNLMLKDDVLWMIDFQGARKGPVAYDAASFIWQAKAPFSYEERQRLEDIYIEKMSEGRPGISKVELKSQLDLMKIFRCLQVLGAYGLRGLIEGKGHFVISIEPALKNLNHFREKGLLKAYPELERIASQLWINKDNITKRDCNLQDISKEKSSGPGKDPIQIKTDLLLTVFSFSYKKGYPEDKSGNGGGFMFDCRGMHNPGRYEEYKDKTGKDAEVKEFLEKRGEVALFLENVKRIVRPSIERYIERGFTSLQVGFGCTGGQHRSVYCAERFGREIAEDYPGIKVNIIHREQI